MKVLILLCLAGIFTMAMAFTFNYQQAKPWAVPEKAASMANPVKSSKESIANGKSLWSMHCSSCHGKMGAGDGSKAAQLKEPLNDFSTATVQSQSDGSLFYKIDQGRDEMPSFKKKIPDHDDIWSLVNYIRTMKK